MTSAAGIPVSGEQPFVALVPLGSHEKVHPDRAFLIVEVAETSLEYDLRTKAALYAASGVPEYWVEVLARPRGGSFASPRWAKPE